MGWFHWEVAVNCNLWRYSPSYVTMKSICDSHVNVIQWLHCEITMIVTLWQVPKWHHDEVTEWLLGERHLMSLLWSHHQRCIVTSFQMAYFDVPLWLVKMQFQGNFSMESSNDGHNWGYQYDSQFMTSHLLAL